MPVTKFQWINLSDDGQKYDTDKRRAVRIQAMKAAAATRKQSGTWGKLNMRQLSVMQDKSPVQQRNSNHCEAQSIKRPQSSIRARDAVTGSCGTRSVPVAWNLASCKDLDANQERRISPFEQWHGLLTRPMPLAGFEALAADTGLDVLDLDELTSVSLGQIAGTLLARKHTSLDKLIARRRQSYLFHLPARYGHTPCLDDALRCLAAKAKHVLAPNSSTLGGELHFISLYGQALRSLQSAVNSDEFSNADVLGAVELLSIYALLDTRGEPTAWANHIAGATRLIRAMGPTNFEDEFEKSLLVSMIPPFLCEAIRLREPCFLEEDAWQAVLQSCTIDDASYFAPRGRGFIHMWMLSAKFPRLLAQVQDVLYKPDSLTATELDELESKCRAAKEEFTKWYREFESMFAAHARHRIPFPKDNVRFEMFGASLVMLSFLSRLISAISLEDHEAQERDAVKYAKHMKQLTDGVFDAHKCANFYLTQKVFSAESILSSTDFWCSRPGNRPRGRLVEKWKWQAWFDQRSDDFEKFHATAIHSSTDDSSQHEAVLTGALLAGVLV
ncbi:hypothetical protein JX266_010263 [Neoarthrinium moseri]|nr:hypothetical protein JX266_010263 [Neoarthrinium moseri]